DPPLFKFQVFGAGQLYYRISFGVGLQTAHGKADLRLVRFAVGTPIPVESNRIVARIHDRNLDSVALGRVLRSPADVLRTKAHGAEVLPLLSLPGHVLNAVESRASKTAAIADPENGGCLLR